MYVGLDIGSTAIRACAITPGESRPELALFDTQDLPPGAVVNGVVTEASQVIEALREVLHRSTVPSPRVVVALPHSATIVQTTEVAIRRGRYDLKAARAAIEERIPAEWGDYALAVSPFNEIDPSDVLLVAAPRAAIDALKHVVRQAGAELAGIDAAAAVSFNVLEHSGKLQGTRAIVDVGLQESRVVLLHGGTIRATAIFPRGGQDLRESLQNALRISAHEAELYKIGGDRPNDGAVPRDVHEQLRVAASTLAEAIAKTIAKAAKSAGVSRVTHLHCIGRGADLNLFYDALTAHSGAAIERPSPLSVLKSDPLEYSAAYLEAVRASASVAMGAALPWSV